MDRSKICIIGNSNIKHISLISLYTSFFDANNVSYDIIYMDRYGIVEESSAANTYRFYPGKDAVVQKRIKSFLRFFWYVRTILKNNSYDIIITWQTTGAYLLSPLLLTKYRHRYIVNVRDYICEKKWPFSNLVKILIDKALFTTISSDGFRSFLPEKDYLKINSINDSLLSNIKKCVFTTPKTIKIGFVGNCRYFKENKKIIDALANDPRFEIWYCGTNSEIFAEYASTQGIKNVFTQGAFDTKETVEIMSRFDIINCAFGNDAIDNSTLIPIRLFTSLKVGKPVIVNDMTQLQKEVEEYGLGLVIKDYSHLANSLCEYFKNFNIEFFYKGSEAYLEKADLENQKFYTVLKSNFCQ